MLHQFELVPVVVPYPKILTIKVVLAKVQDTKLMKYLPDEPHNHVTRDYLFTIVNSLDQGFFPRIMEEI